MKVHDAPPGDGAGDTADGPAGMDGAIEISAPPSAVPEAEWERRIDRVLEEVQLALLRRQRSERPPPEAPLPPER